MGAMKTIMLKLSGDIPEERALIRRYEQLPRQRRGEWLRNAILRGIQSGDAGERGVAAETDTKTPPKSGSAGGKATSTVKGLFSGKGGQ